MGKNDETDLVDVGDLPHEEEVTAARRHGVSEEPVTAADDESTEAQTDHTSEDPFAMQMEAAKPGQATIASIRERLAAFLVDVGFLWLFYWACLYGFHKITTHSWIGPVPTMGTVAFFFHGALLLIAFLYFFLLEAAFFATIGKFCCWMYVRRKDGRHAGALGIFIRNFFRLIELLTAGLLTWVPMELTRRHQRLGDLAAGTIVIKKHSATARYYTLDADRLASAFGRSLAQTVDLLLVGVWLVGYVMLINYQWIYTSQWLVIAFPVLSILFWTLAQFILETTPGLWLFGYTITHEDGGRLTFAGALMRVLLSPLDLLMGLPCMLLSLRKQKIGDMVAATVVSQQRRRWKGAVGSLVIVALSVGLVALGLFINPTNNVFKAGADFKLSFMPMVEGLPDWESANMASPPVLTVRNFRFGVNDPNTRRTPPVYEAGETVYLLFEMYGYVRKDRLVWIQEDLMVQYPDGSIGLKQENVVDYHQLIKPGGGPIELTNNIALPGSAAPGTYVVTVTLRDMLAEKFTVTETQSFTVKPPIVTTSPLEALPPPPPVPSPIPVMPYGTPPAGPMPTAAEPTPPSGAPTVPSSPLPVLPTAPVTPPTSPAPGTTVEPQKGLAPVQAPAVPTAPAIPPAPTPTTGFTVLPGPSIAPKDETAPPATIPVPVPPTPVPVPADQYAKPLSEKSVIGVPPVDQYAKPVVPTPVTPPAAATTTTTTTTTTTAPVAVPVPTPAPTPEKPSIVEKTLTPEVKPAEKLPADQYAKPIEKTVAPAVVPAPQKTTPPVVKPVPKAKVPVTPPAAAPKTKAAATTDIQKAAEKELQKVAPAPIKPPAEKTTPAVPVVTPPAKPASEIPSAEAVKKQAEQPAPAPKKKKKSSSGGGSGAGYMP